MNAKRRRNLFAIFFGLIILAWLPVQATAQRRSTSAEGEVMRVWERAKRAGEYGYSADILQTTIPLVTITNVGRQSETQRMYLEGETNLRDDQMSLVYYTNGGSVTNPDSGVQIEVDGDTARARQAGGQWEEIEDFTGLFSHDSDVMAFLVAATNIERAASSGLENSVLPVSDMLTRYTFDVDGPAYAEFIRSQMQEEMTRSGELPMGMTLSASELYAGMSGTGELWISADGLPVRQLIELAFPAREGVDHRTNATLDIAFHGFEQSFVGAMDGHWSTFAFSIPAFSFPTNFVSSFAASTLMLSVIAVIGLQSNRRRQWAMVWVILVPTLFNPFVQMAQAADFSAVQEIQASGREAQEAEQQERDRIADELYTASHEPNHSPIALAEAQAVVASTVAATGAVTAPTTNDVPNDATDTDGDGLTDYVETQLGTFPDLVDSDGDTVSDYDEITGFSYAGQMWYGDALERDSNADGVDDAREWWVDTDKNGIPDDTDGDGTPDLFDDDNDGDGVLDRYDMSAYQKSAETFTDSAPFSFQISDLTPQKYTYVNFQLRPTDPEFLWYAFNPIDWPSDRRGHIQDHDDKTFFDTNPAAAPVERNGDMRIVPVLEITIDTTSGNGAHLPPSTTDANGVTTYPDLTPYKITVRETVKEQEKKIYVPLQLVIDEQQTRQAFEGKMLYLPESANWGNNHTVRLAWMLQGLVDTCASYEDAQKKQQPDCQRTGEANVQQVLHVYYDDWIMTGFDVREDHGTDAAVIYEDPDVDTSYHEGALFASTYGFEQAFLSARDVDNNGRRDISVRPSAGDTSIASLLDRDNHPNADKEPTWGLPNIFQVVTTETYEHQDKAIYQLGASVSRGILDDTFTHHYSEAAPIYPTLLYMREESYRATNLDALAHSGDYVNWSGRVLSVDLHPDNQSAESIQTVASMTMVPYCREGGDWVKCKLDTYWDVLEQFHAEDTSVTGKDPEIAAGELLMIQLYFTTLFNSVTQVVAVDGAHNPSNGLSSDSKIALTLTKIGSAVARSYIKFVVNDVALARIVTTPLLKQIGKQAIERGGIVGATSILKDLTGVLKNARANVGKIIAGTLGIVIIAAVVLAVIVTLIILYFYPKTSKVVVPIVLLLITAVQFVISIVKPIISVVKTIVAVVNTGATAIQATGQVLGGATQILGVATAGLALGFVLTAISTWGVAIFQIILLAANGALTATAAVTVVLTAVANTIFALALFILSLTSVAGLLLAALIGILYSLVTGVLSLLCAAGVRAVCDFKNQLSKIAVAIFYEENSLFQLDTVTTGRTDIEFDRGQGYAAGNSIRVSFPITTVGGLRQGGANFYRSYEPLLRPTLNPFADSKSVEHIDSIVRSASVFYELSDSNLNRFELEQNQMREDWEVNSGKVTPENPHVSYVSKQDAVAFSKTLQAGIDSSLAPLYFNIGQANGKITCVKFLLESCTVKGDETERNFITSSIGELYVFDVVPATVDQFYTLHKTQGEGYTLNWDDRFNGFLDADGDGVISQLHNGNDPDDSQWDTDGDGLSDARELALRAEGIAVSPESADTDGDSLDDLTEVRLNTNPANPDSDYDGLTDAQEISGWDITINNTLYHVTSDPLSQDGDGDGISDHTEYSLDSQGFHPRVVNDSPLASYVTTNDADGFLHGGQDVNVTTTISNTLPNVYWSGGEATFTYGGALAHDSVVRPLGFNTPNSTAASATTSLTVDPNAASGPAEVSSTASVRLEYLLKTEDLTVQSADPYNELLDESSATAALSSQTDVDDPFITATITELTHSIRSFRVVNVHLNGLSYTIYDPNEDPSFPSRADLYGTPTIACASDRNICAVLVSVRTEFFSVHNYLMMLRFRLVPDPNNPSKLAFDHTWTGSHHPATVDQIHSQAAPSTGNVDFGTRIASNGDSFVVLYNGFHHDYDRQLLIKHPVSNSGAYEPPSVLSDARESSDYAIVGVNDNYTTVWLEDNSPNNKEMWGATLDGTGSLVAKRRIIQKPATSQIGETTLAFNPSSARMLLAYNLDDAIVGQALSTTLERVGSSRQLAATPAESPAVAFDPRSGAWLVGWQTNSRFHYRAFSDQAYGLTEKTNWTFTTNQQTDLACLGSITSVTKFTCVHTAPFNTDLRKTQVAINRNVPINLPSQRETVNLVVDNDKPTSSVTSLSEGAIIKANGTLIVGGSADDTTSGIAKVEVSVNNGAWQPAIGGGSWAHTLSVSTEGTYTIRTRATDVVGFVEEAIQTRTFQVDNTAPTATAALPADVIRADPHSDGSFTVALSGTGSDGGIAVSGFATLEAQLSPVGLQGAGGTWQAATVTNGTWQIPAYQLPSFGAEPSGRYQVQVRATDSAGNQSAAIVVGELAIDNAAPVASLHQFVVAEGDLIAMPLNEVASVTQFVNSAPTGLQPAACTGCPVGSGGTNGVQFNNQPLVFPYSAETTNAALPEREMSVAMWVRPDRYAPNMGFMSAIEKVNAKDAGWAIGTHDGNLFFELATEGGGDDVTRMEAWQHAPPHQWNHVAATYDGETTRLYQNGVLVAESADPSGNIRYDGVNHHFLGGYASAAHWSMYFGRMSDVHLFDHAITVDEITQLYRNVRQTPEPEVNLPFDKRDATNKWIDLTGNGHHATCRGSCPITVGQGSTGASVLFDGVDDVLQLPVNISETSYGASLWLKTECVDCGIFEITDRGGAFDRTIFTSGGRICAFVFTSETICTAETFADNGWHHVVHTFGGDVGAQRLYVDGVHRATGQLTASIFNFDTYAFVGYVHEKPYLVGQIDDVRLFNSALSQFDVAQLSRDTSPNDMRVHLPLNEPISQLTQTNLAWDASGNGHVATCQGATCPASSSAGVHGTTLVFDGVDDHLTLPDAPIVGLGGGDFTVSAWINLETYDTNIGRPIVGGLTRGDGQNIHMLVRNQRLYMDFWNSSVGGKTVVQTGQWYHATFRYTAETSELALFLNGQLDAVAVSRFAPQQTDAVQVGRFLYGYWDGAIDDLRIYQRPLSNSEIAALSGALTPAHGKRITGIATETAGFRDDISSVDVAYVPMSQIEAQANTITHLRFEEQFSAGDGDGNPLADSSGNQLHGTCSGDGCPTTTTGKGQDALQFDGVDDQVELATGDELGFNSGDFTVAAWMRVDAFNSFNEPLISGMTGEQNKNVHLVLRERKWLMSFWGNDTFGTQELEVARWYHVAFRYTVSTGQQAIYIDGQLDNQTVNHIPPEHVGKVYLGGSLGGNLDGAVDDFRVYQRALNEAEIGRLAQSADVQGRLKLHLTFDRQPSQRLADSSGNALHGTCSTNTCPVSVAGEVDRAMQFDGVDDHVVLNTGETLGLKGGDDFTVAAWLYVDQFNGGDEPLLSGLTAESNQNVHLVLRDRKWLMAFWDNDTFGNQVLDANRWYHVVFRYSAENSGVQTIFVDGQIDAQTSNHVRPQHDGLIYIGRSLGGYLNGALDDLRIYKRALSDAEVAALSQSANNTTWHPATLEPAINARHGILWNAPLPTTRDRFAIMTRATDTLGNQTYSPVLWQGLLGDAPAQASRMSQNSERSIMTDIAPPQVTLTTELIRVDDLGRYFTTEIVGTITSADPDAIVDVQIGSNGEWQAATVSAGNWSLELEPIYLTAESMTTTVRATDGANQQTIITETVTVDIAAPTFLDVAFSYDQDGTWQTLTNTYQTLTDASMLRMRWTIEDDDLVELYAGLTESETATREQLTELATTDREYVGTVNDQATMYAHLIGVDAVGNETVSSSGPYYIDRVLTPDLVTNLDYNDWHNDDTLIGLLQTTALTESVATLSTLAAQQQLYGSWDADGVRLDWQGADWDVDGDLFIYFDTVSGGATTLYNPYPATQADTLIYLPGNRPELTARQQQSAAVQRNARTLDAHEADYLVWIQDSDNADLMRWDGDKWVLDTVLTDAQFQTESSTTALYLPFNALGVGDPTSVNFKMLAVASEEYELRLWGAMPNNNPANSERVVSTNGFAESHRFAMTHQYQWLDMGAGIAPSDGQFVDSRLAVTISADPDGITYSLLQSGLFWLWDAVIFDDVGSEDDVFSFLDTDIPAVGIDEEINFTVTVENKGTRPANQVVVDIAAWDALHLPDVFDAGEFENLIVDMGDIPAGETATFAFVGELDDSDIVAVYEECMADEPEDPDDCYNDADEFGWATLDAFVDDGLSAELSADPLEWIWVDHSVDAVPPVYLSIDTPQNVVGSDVVSIAGYVYDESQLAQVELIVTNLADDATQALACVVEGEGGFWSCEWDNRGAINGDHFALSARAIDIHGHVGNWSAPNNVTVDAIRPTVSIGPDSAALDDATVGVETVAITGLADDNSGVTAVEVCTVTANSESCETLATVAALSAENLLIIDDIPATPIAFDEISAACGGGEIIRTFEVGSSFVVGDIKLGFNASHAYRGDVWVELISPEGTLVNVIVGDDSAGAESADFDILLDDTAGLSLFAGGGDDIGRPFYDRRVAPTEPLSTFVGEDAAGTWQLTLCDDGDDDAGTYQRSQLILAEAGDDITVNWPWRYLLNVSENTESITRTLQVTSLDEVGNRSAEPVALTLNIDTVAPVITVTQHIATPTPSEMTAPILSGTVSDNSTTADVVVRGYTDAEQNLWADVAVDELTGEWAFTLTPQAVGDHTFWIDTTDRGGNSTTSGPYHVTVPVYADLTLFGTVQTTTVRTGEIMTVTLTVFNNGPSANENVHVVASTSLAVRHVTTTMGTCSISGIDCELPTLMQQQSAVIVIVLDNEAGDPFDALYFSAMVDGSLPDSSHDNNKFILNPNSLALTLTEFGVVNRLSPLWFGLLLALSGWFVLTRKKRE